MKILCIGEALIDMICTDKGSSLSEGNHFLKKPGGAPTNVAAAIAALGGPVELAAKVGKDPFGKQLIAVMRDFGVSTEWMMEDEDHFTTVAYVSLMEDGERDFVFNRGADGWLSKEDVELIDLSEVSIVHFGSATAFLPGPLNEAYLYLLRKARQQNKFISFDPNYRQLLFGNRKQSFTEQAWEYLRSCDFCKLSDEEAMLITGCATVDDSAKMLLEKTSTVFCITLGKEGTLLGCDTTTKRVPSIPVQPVDTTGAGDAFVGAVLYQLNEHQVTNSTPLALAHWEKIIMNANKAGARTCEYMGAMEAFKHLSAGILE